MRVAEEGDRTTVEGSWYRLEVVRDRPFVTLEDETGRWADLRPLATVDALDGPDETLASSGPDVERHAGGVRLTWALTSSRWRTKRLVMDGRDDGIDVHVEVDGPGRITDVRLLGGGVVGPRGSGMIFSGAWFETLFSAAPADPARIVRRASESAVNTVASGSEPGRGAWFFTPGPFCYAVSRARADDDATIPPGPWLTIALAARAGEAGFVGFGYDARDRGFSLVLDYEGKPRATGTWRSPAVVIGRAPDPYEGIAAHRRRLERDGLAPRAPDEPPAEPAWWRQPMFCGWGAQVALAFSRGLPMAAAAGLATEANYEAFLEHLEARRIVPGTVVVDDKWQATYGRCEPDPAKWPDLRAWIGRRHDRGQRVLLWWKAWDAEGLPPEATVQSSKGTILGVDPTSPSGEDAVRDAVRRIVGDLDADGLKIDFTARTPTGIAIRHHGPEWGTDLLRRLLEIVCDEAKRIKPEALLVGHAPNPIVAPALDMLRLNDALRLDDPEPRAPLVPQMRYRAAVVRAACPGHLVDTDDWCAADLTAWRAYAKAKIELGVPALYYVDRLDLSREALTDDDYELVRTTWAEYRRREGLPTP